MFVSLANSLTCQLSIHKIPIPQEVAWSSPRDIARAPLIPGEHLTPVCSPDLDAGRRILTSPDAKMPLSTTVPSYDHGSAPGTFIDIASREQLETVF
ncbi:hypothetical protein TNCV_3386921 [Trichonephila clavipes]|nr:hypothetical protein TNCV_3386921 [Trichonephila clavipes]